MIEILVLSASVLVFFIGLFTGNFDYEVFGFYGIVIIMVANFVAQFWGVARYPFVLADAALTAAYIWIKGVLKK